MTMKDHMVRHRRLAATIVAAMAIALAGTAAWLTHRPVAPAPAGRAEIEMVVRDYILAHPEIIPEAMERLRDKQGQNVYATNRAALETPFASAWAGDAHGDVTLVMFSDYACGYCRSSVPDIDRLLASDPKLKVVWREIPILGAGSELAARAALAAAQQGAFRDFHQRMFAAGVPDGEKVAAVVGAMKLDAARIARDAASPAVVAELRRNLDLAGKVDESIATPTFVVGGQILKGAVGFDALQKAVADARKQRVS